jgi:hypothetical protein
MVWNKKNCSLHPKFGVRSKVWSPNFLFVDCGLKFLTQSLALNFEGQEKMFFAFNYGLKLLAPNFKLKKKFEAKKNCFQTPKFSHVVLQKMNLFH